MTAVILFFSDPPALAKSVGSGWFGPPKGTHLPGSGHIQNLEEARRYWLDHFGGKTIPLDVHTKDNDPRKIRPIRVYFGEGNDHAYTDSLSETGHKLARRVFSLSRSQRMSSILAVIEHPSRRLRSGFSDLFLEGRVDGKHYTVVLIWKAQKGVYEFQSAHFRTAEEVARMYVQQPPRRDDGPLYKSESPNLATEAFWFGLPGDQAFRKETLAGWPLLPTPLSRRLKY